jgi:hypothetical protein
MDVGRPRRAVDPCGSSASMQREVTHMVLATMFGLLALFALLGVLLGSEDPRHNGMDPRSEVKFWMRYSIR